MLQQFFNVILRSVYGVFAESGLGASFHAVSASFITMCAVYAGYLLFCYLFLGFGLYTMARRREMKIAYLAWIPIANTYLLGKLAGGENGKFLGVKLIYIVFAALCLQVLSVAMQAVTDYFYLPVLKDTWGDVANEESYFYLYGYATYNQDGSLANYVPGVLDKLPGYVSILSSLSQIAMWLSNVVYLVLLIFLFHNYAPRSFFWFAVLSFVFPVLGPIFIFAIRKNSCTEYREFMRMKMHSMYGGGNPYDYADGSYRDPYDLSDKGKKGEDAPESPFGEYDGKK